MRMLVMAVIVVAVLVTGVLGMGWLHCESPPLKAATIGQRSRSPWIVSMLTPASLASRPMVIEGMPLSHQIPGKA
jgi:hypothetical protein